jgi:hypothetical protein
MYVFSFDSQNVRELKFVSHFCILVLLLLFLLEMSLHTDMTTQLKGSFYLFFHLYHVSQPTNQPIDQPTNQPTSQPANWQPMAHTCNDRYMHACKQTRKAEAENPQAGKQARYYF